MHCLARSSRLSSVLGPHHVTFSALLPSSRSLLPIRIPCLPFIRTLGVMLGPPRQSRSVSPAEDPELHHTCKRLPFCLSRKGTPRPCVRVWTSQGPITQPVTTCRRRGSSLPLQNPAYRQSSSLMPLASLPVAVKSMTRLTQRPQI